MASEGVAPTASEYIKHHLQNLTYGQLPEGYERYDGTVLTQDTWTIAHGAAEAKAMGFWAIHLDTMFFSIGLGLLFTLLFYMAAKRATAGIPAGWQNFVEMMVDFINENVRGSFSGKNDLVAPLALGALSLSREKAIVSRLQSIEEMAGIDILFTDKTGIQVKLVTGIEARCDVVEY